MSRRTCSHVGLDRQENKWMCSIQQTRNQTRRLGYSGPTRESRSYRGNFDHMAWGTIRLHRCTTCWKPPLRSCQARHQQQCFVHNLLHLVCCSPLAGLRIFEHAPIRLTGRGHRHMTSRLAPRSPLRSHSTPCQTRCGSDDEHCDAGRRDPCIYH